MIWFPRLVGILTALYGLSAIARPDVIARDGELASSSHRRSAVGLLSATVGMRDLVSGIAIVLAPAGGVLLAGAVHAGAFDVGDAAVFGRLLPAAAARRKIRGHGAGLGHSAGALDDLSERLTFASP